MLVHQRQSPLNPGRVVILGAGGFLSPVLKRTLEGSGINTLALGSKTIDLMADSAREALASELHASDVVVMTAGLTPDRGRDVGTLMANLRMGESVAWALARQTVSQLIYISSDGVYDGRTTSLLNEDSSCEPADLYCLMHIGREKILGQATKAVRIPFTIVRPCAIYGAGDTHNSYGPNRFARTATESGKITLFGNGEEKRHHVFVGDVAEVIRLCIVHGSTGVINAATGNAVSFAEAAGLIARAAGPGVAIECLPRATAVTHRHFDLSALAQAFPDFRAMPLEKGLAQMTQAMTQTITMPQGELCPR